MAGKTETEKAETIYAVTNISHGREDDGRFDRRTNKVVPVYYSVGDVVDTTLFSKDELAALLEAGALSLENPIKETLPDLELAALPSADDLPNAGTEEKKI